MTKAEAVKRIKAMKPGWRTSMIEVGNVQSFRGRYYTILNFNYKGEAYEYRKDKSAEWIDRAGAGVRNTDGERVATMIDGILTRGEYIAS